MRAIKYWYVNRPGAAVPQDAPEVDWELSSLQDLNDKITTLPNYPSDSVTAVYLKTQRNGRWRFEPLSEVTALPAVDPLVLKVHNKGATWCSLCARFVQRHAVYVGVPPDVYSYHVLFGEVLCARVFYAARRSSMFGIKNP